MVAFIYNSFAFENVQRFGRMRIRLLVLLPLKSTMGFESISKHYCFYSLKNKQTKKQKRHLYITLRAIKNKKCQSLFSHTLCGSGLICGLVVILSWFQLVDANDFL